MIRSLTLVLLAACGSATELPGSAPVTTGDWGLGPPPPSEVSEAERDQPFDPRLATMHPERHRGGERVCDLGFVGELHALSRRELSRYDQPLSHRMSVRCLAASGTGWADLVFAKDSASLAAYVRAGQRIRVRVVGPGGFDDMPVFAFVADIGPAPSARPERWIFASVPAGDDLDTVQQRGTCAVAHMGTITPTGTTTPSHRATVMCRHALGERAVEMLFPSAVQMSALRLRRGEVVAVIVDDTTTENAELRVVVYDGP